LFQKGKFTNIDDLREAIFKKFVENSLMLLINNKNQYDQAVETFQCCDYHYKYLSPTTQNSTTEVPPPPNQCGFIVPKRKRRNSITSSVSSSAGGSPNRFPKRSRSNLGSQFGNGNGNSMSNLGSQFGNGYVMSSASSQA